MGLLLRQFKLCQMFRSIRCNFPEKFIPPKYPELEYNEVRALSKMMRGHKTYWTIKNIVLRFSSPIIPMFLLGD